MQDFSGLILLVLLIVVFYFMLIRPQKKRVDAHRRLIESLSVGDEIVTVGGIRGRVQELSDEEFRLEVAPGTTLSFVKNAVSRKITPDVDVAAGEQGRTAEDGT